MIRIGIVGLGDTIGIAKMHIKGYLCHQDKAVITALYDIIPGRAEKYKEKFGLTAKICGSYEEMLEEADAVSICTPNAVHISMAVEALKKGKHVLCEKPFGTNAEECQEAVNWAELSQRVCMFGLCYRGIPALCYMKELIDDDFLGTPYYLRSSLGGGRITNPDVRCEWRMQRGLSGPGALADFGSHTLDIADWLLRGLCGPIRMVQCMENCFIRSRLSVNGGGEKAVSNDDVAVFNARMESGMLCSFTTSRIGGEHTLEIYGSQGYLAFSEDNPFTVTACKFGENAKAGPKKELPVPEELYIDSETVPVKEPFAINFYYETGAFLSSIETGRPVPTDFGRGLYLQKLIDALHNSAEMGTALAIDFDR